MVIYLMAIGILDLIRLFIMLHRWTGDSALVEHMNVRIVRTKTMTTVRSC